MQTTIDHAHLFALRCAAGAWLQEHADDPNAPQVRRALIATNEAYQPDARADEQVTR